MALVAKAFQDIITFSRATQTGTYVNSSGYITNSSVLNYLTYSNAPENAAWTKSNSFVQQNLAINSQDFDLWTLGAGVSVAANSTIAPDGTLTADRITFTAGGAAEFVRRTATLTVGTIYTVSVYAQIATGTPTFIFDIGNGSGASTSQTPTAAWQRFTFTFTFSGANQWVDLEASGAGTIAFWGAQLVQGSVPGDYRATTSAALPCLYADYNGALRARKLSETTSATRHEMTEATPTTVLAGATYTFSINAKVGERTAFVVFFSTGETVGDAYAVFNLALGTVHFSSGGTAAIVNSGNGMYRCSFNAVTVGTTLTPFVGLLNALSTTRLNSYTGDGSSGIYIADAQLNDGSAATAYYETTANAYNAPRFDYDPVTLAPKGLLVEEQRVNLLLQSNAFTTAPWAAGANTNLTAASTLSPDGTINAWKLYASNGLGAAGLNQAVTKAASAITYACSVFSKAAGQNWLQIALFDGTNGNRYWFNVSTGAVGTTAVIGAGFTGVSANIVPAGNGFYRCVLVATSSTAVSIQVYLYPSAADGANGVGDASGNGVYIYGSQLEAGAFATSAIPTTASQVTRAADVASVNTLSPWFNSATGTFYAEYLINSFANSCTAISLNASNSGFNVSGSGAARWWNGTTNVSTVNTVATGINRKEAFAFASGARDICLNGGAVATDTSVSWPSLPSAMFLGSAASGANTQNINGWLRRITYYPRRLTNAELQTLTTL